jgi:hypothetical protein
MGAGAAALLPGLQHRLFLHRGAVAVPPILSVEAAQRQVPFRIRVPGYLPAGARLDGVRVGLVVQRNREQVQAQIRVNTQPSFGYGIVLTFDLDHNRIFVRGLPDSPAERAGLGGEFGVQLVEANGYRPRSATYEADYAGLLGHRVNDSARRPAIQKNPPLLWRMAPEPLRLTVKDPDGKIRTIVIPGRQNWTFRPEQPSTNAAGNRAALLFTVGGRRFVLHEHRTVAEERQAMPPKAEPIVVKGTEVWLSGPPATPAAFWQHGGVDFLLDNYQYAMSRQDILRVTESLLEPQSGSGQASPGPGAVAPRRPPGASPSEAGGKNQSGHRPSRRLRSIGL